MISLTKEEGNDNDDNRTPPMTHSLVVLDEQNW